jgi:hypothetical protein
MITTPAKDARVKVGIRRSKDVAVTTTRSTRRTSQMQAERQRRWYANLTPEQREARRLRQRKDFDHSETMSPEVRSARAMHGLDVWRAMLADETYLRTMRRMNGETFDMTRGDEARSRHWRACVTAGLERERKNMDARHARLEAEMEEKFAERRAGVL